MRVFSFYNNNGFLWFRIFGVGLHFKDTRRHSLLFSERNGYCSHIQLGNWSIKVLKNK